MAEQHDRSPRMRIDGPSSSYSERFSAAIMQPHPHVVAAAAVPAAAAAAAPGPFPFHAFFGPWEPPPAYAPAPLDQAQADRVRVLVKHSVTSGPAFLNTVRERNQADPSFAFLHPQTEGHAFWKWALFCATQGWNPDQPPGAPAAAAAPPAAGPALQHLTNHQLSPEAEGGFNQVLDVLSGAKVRRLALGRHCAAARRRRSYRSPPDTRCCRAALSTPRRT